MWIKIHWIKWTSTYPFTINMNDEFNQMFYEAWGDLQENYYNEKFNGVNWAVYTRQVCCLFTSTCKQEMTSGFY